VQHVDPVLENIRRLLTYDATSGEFYWRETRGRRKQGALAGNVSPRGYRRIHCNGRAYFAHQLAWYMHYGVFPHTEIDHIDRNRDNNRIANLRLSNRTEQLHNTGVRTDNSSGYKGISWESGRFRTYINIGGTRVHLGRYMTFDEAYRARKRAEMELL
jgi:hypothetical protein